jgi:hypothetical protein
MAEVKIDNELYKEILKFIKKGKNRFDFPTIKSFVDKSILETLKTLKEKEKKKDKN